MPGLNDPANAIEVWTQFCHRYCVLEGSVSLFAADAQGVVAHRTIGRGETARLLLSRAAEMEALVRTEVAKLVDDWQSGSNRCDGLIYCMGWREPNLFMPLYIGKAETLGKGDGNLSANLKHLATDRSKFARWGDNYAYHIGDLSACVLPGHKAEKRAGKYEAWAKTLFENAPSLAPQLKRPVVGDNYQVQSRAGTPAAAHTLRAAKFIAGADAGCSSIATRPVGRVSRLAGRERPVPVDQSRKPTFRKPPFQLVEHSTSTPRPAGSEFVTITQTARR